MRIEDGVIVGSNGKYELKNPIARYLIAGFDRAVSKIAGDIQPASILEVGCGEGHVTELLLASTSASITATDLSRQLVDELRATLVDDRVSFAVADMMTLELDSPVDMVACCEVLEHLPDPGAGLSALHGLGAREYLLSVPREPVWRIMNMCRGAYLSDFGNSPGHLNHFSKRGFLNFVKTRFEVLEVLSPLPWTILRCRPL